MAGVGDQHGIGGQVVGELLADALRPDRLGVGVEVGSDLVAEVLNQLLRPLHPLGAGDRLQGLDQTGDGGLGVTLDGYGGGEAAAQLGGVDVNLDDLAAGQGNAPVQG